MRLLLTYLSLLLSSAVFAQECNIWYVGPNASGTGTKASPAALQTALNGVVPGTEHIRLAVGTYTYDQQLDLVNGAVLDGGYDPGSWTKSNNGITQIYRTNANVTPMPERLVAISAVNLTGFRLQDIDVEVQDAGGIGVTTYGIYVSGCSNYNIVRCRVTAGNGSNGVNGVPGVDGQAGANGADGLAGNQCGGGNIDGGLGGNAWSGGTAAGGDGGDGGIRGGDWYMDWCSGWLGIPYPCAQDGDAFDGQPGANGGGVSGGPGGIAGFGYNQNLPTCYQIPLIGTWVWNCQAGGPNFGQPGQDALAVGADGANGLNGIPTHNGGFFVPGDGQNGVDGEDGSGGGGGGGGGGFGEEIFWLLGNGKGSGPGGGGGGEGGQGGTGATGGLGGGGSFGIYVDNNGTGGVIGDCQVTAGVPGIGGIGGFPGGYGGFAGIGGQGGSDCGTGGDGGDGSDGGDGGAGGNGASGESQPIYQDPFGIPATQYSLNANVEPEVVLNSTGCTFSDIEFSTNAFGIIEWFYEGGTNPANDLGAGTTNQYYNLGYHGATMVSNGVPYQLSDFVHIFQDGTPFIPTIQATADTICPNETVNFSATWPSVFNVLDYRWDFGDPASGNNTSSSANPSHPYAEVGTYLVQLQTESPCCGWSKIDSFYVEVIPNVTPEVFITVSSTEICEGETVSFGAVPYFGGPNPTYEWFHNNASVGTGPAYNPATLADGDEVFVRMTSSYPCPPNAQDDSEIIVMTVHPLPIIDCSNVANSYLGAQTLFDAQVTGNGPFDFAWQLGDGAFSTDSTPSHEYGSTGVYDASVEVTDIHGCSDVCDVQVTITLPPYVEAGFTYVINQVCGETTVQFTDTSTGNPNSWIWDFGDGQTSTDPSPFITFGPAGPYSVSLIASNGIFTDTVVIPNLVEVWEIPVASFYPDTTEQCDSLALRFFDESADAVEWSWDFGDDAPDGDSSNLQNPYHVYNDPGVYTVTLTVTSDDGCTADAPTVEIEIFKTPISQFFVDSPVCATVPVDLVDWSYDDDYISEWTYRIGKDQPEVPFNGATLDPYVHVFEEPGMYEITQYVRNDNGCSDSSKHWVEVVPYPIASFYPDSFHLYLPDSVMNFHNISLHAVDSISNWDFGNDTGVEDFRDPYGIYPDSGLFTVTLWAENELGCIDDTTAEIRVWEQETFFIADAFTPNGDGINEIFDIKEKGITEWHMTIYDRWGQIIFESFDVKESWNGKNMFSGKDMPQESYPYRIRLKWYSGREFEKMGTITLIR